MTNSPASSNKCSKEGYTTFDGGKNCYKFVPNDKAWSLAKDYCEQNEGAQLVSIRDGCLIYNL